jgi:hypothetical protein
MWQMPNRMTPSAKTYALIDQSRAMGDCDVGAIVSLFTGEKGFGQAQKAAKKIKHPRVVQLIGKHQWRAGDHVNGKVDIEHERNARWL